MSVAGIMFNTGIGQHILKNPLIVNSIIEKVCSSASVSSAENACIHTHTLKTLVSTGFPLVPRQTQTFAL